MATALSCLWLCELNVKNLYERSWKGKGRVLFLCISLDGNKVKGKFLLIIRHQMRQDYPLNLSILISGGKETNKDSHSNCE